MTQDPAASGEELLRDLQQLQAYAARFQAVIGKAREAAPPRAEAWDSRHVARAEIDGTGMPTTLQVERGWEQRVGAEELGAVLMEAYQTAVRSHLTAWGDDLQRQGWKYDARDVDLDATPPPIEPPFRAPASFTSPRSLSQLTEDVLGELDRAHELASAPPAPARAEVTEGRVSITLSDGALAGVSVDPQWAGGQQAASINAALATALQAARLRPTAPPTDTAHRDELDQMLAEVLSLLTQQRRS